MIINLQCSIVILAQEYIHDVKVFTEIVKQLTFGMKLKFRNYNSLAITVAMFNNKVLYSVLRVITAVLFILIVLTLYR